MKKILKIMALFATFNAHAKQFPTLKLIGDSRACAPLVETIANQLQWEIVSLPKDINAGQQLRGKIKFSKNFQLSPNDWHQKHTHSSIRMATKQPYPHIFHTDLASNLSGFFFDLTKEIELPFSYDIAPHIGGEFQLEFSILLYGKKPNVHMCMVIGRFDQHLHIHSNDVHMVPPLLRSLSVDKASYVAGDYVTAHFTLTSPLDTLDTDHFEWVNTALPQGSKDRGFPEFENKVYRRLTLNEDGSYTGSIKIPRWVKPGTYYLKYFNRQDKYRNFESDVGEHDAEELRISQSAPVVVTEACSEI